MFLKKISGCSTLRHLRRLTKSIEISKLDNGSFCRYNPPCLISMV